MKKFRFQFLVLVATALWGRAALAQTYFMSGPGSEPAPDVAVQEHLGALLPMGAVFQDDEGRSDVPLSTYFSTGKPVILQMGYFSCPRLCTAVSQSMIESVKHLDARMGKDFQFVFVSIDPKETFDVAASKKKTYVDQYGDPSAASGVHFLVSSEDNIKRLAETVGFKYQWIQVGGQVQYAHSAVLILVMPDGRVSRYLYGDKFDPTVVEQSIKDAAGFQKDASPSLLEGALLYCMYDLHEGKYTASAFKIMRTAGGITVLVMGFFLIRYWYREAKKNRDGNEVSGGGTPAAPTT